MRTILADAKLFDALGREMVRVDSLRTQLSPAVADHLLQEFMMRREIMRARLFLQQRNSPEARRMLKVLARFTDDPRP